MDSPKRPTPSAFAENGVMSHAQSYYLYCITEVASKEIGPCKIGFATHLWTRLSALQGGNWRPIGVAWYVQLLNRLEANDVEQHCLLRFRPNPYGGKRTIKLCSEWVEASPNEILDYALKFLNCSGERIVRVE